MNRLSEAIRCQAAQNAAQALQHTKQGDLAAFDPTRIREEPAWIQYGMCKYLQKPFYGLERLACCIAE